VIIERVLKLIIKKQKNINAHDKEEYKANFSLEAIHYGNKYCLSVTKQMV
jgi:hypothetical protein